MSFDLKPLHNACAALEESLGYLHSDLARQDPALRRQFRAASIQAFEFTYEVAYRMLKRQLEQISETPADVDRMTYMQIIRSSAEAGLLTNVQGFQLYRDMRDTPLPVSVLARLAEEFDESDLPFKVDLVDWASTSESFRRLIETQAVRVG